MVTDTLDVATLPTWSRKRTLLIGDAAHATSPHAGQGASLALEDAMRLGRLMQDGQELGADLPDFRGRAPPARRKDRRDGPPQRQQQARVQRHRRLDPRPDDETAAAARRAKGMDWMYAYDPRGGVAAAQAAVVPRSRMLGASVAVRRGSRLDRERVSGILDRPVKLGRLRHRDDGRQLTAYFSTANVSPA